MPIPCKPFGVKEMVTVYRGCAHLTTRKEGAGSFPSREKPWIRKATKRYTAGLSCLWQLLMRPLRPMAKGLLLSLSVLWIGVALCLVVEPHATSAEAFSLQKQFGGLGLGAHAAPTSCFFLFDPRIEPYCPNLQRPLPALPTFCPRHSTTVSLFPAVRTIGDDSSGSDKPPGRLGLM